MFEVQEYTLCDGWINAWTEGIDELPSQFETREKAQQELDDFLFDQHEAVLQGCMVEDYDENNYRIVEIKEEN